eukprot:73527-Hanusia_phi.AAC.1
MQRQDSIETIGIDCLCLDDDSTTKADRSAVPKGQDRGGSFERCVVACTPSHAFGPAMLSFIENQINMPRKQWIYEVIEGTREQDNVLLDTPDM